jgi:DNA-binding transcriptional MerR regulator
MYPRLAYTLEEAAGRQFPANSWTASPVSLAHRIELVPYCLSQVQMAKHASQRQGESESVIPDKLYFRIGEVARLCGIEAYVLRFWESEFPQLRINKSGTGQRLYRKRDVELVLRIKRLLYSEGYTIAGARQVFASEAKEPRKKAQAELPLKQGREEAAKANVNANVDAKLKKLRSELKDILGMLSAPPAKLDRHANSHRDARTSQENDPGLFDR